MRYITSFTMEAPQTAESRLKTSSSSSKWVVTSTLVNVARGSRSRRKKAAGAFSLHSFGRNDGPSTSAKHSRQAGSPCGSTSASYHLLYGSTVSFWTFGIRPKAHARSAAFASPRSPPGSSQLTRIERTYEPRACPSSPSSARLNVETCRHESMPTPRYRTWSTATFIGWFTSAILFTSLNSTYLQISRMSSSGSRVPSAGAARWVCEASRPFAPFPTASAFSPSSAPSPLTSSSPPYRVVVGEYSRAVPGVVASSAWLRTSGVYGCELDRLCTRRRQH
ncbi:hypothetical protein BD413DRAFT_226898 [Trametes elegans]|nr:hypothetical protein BD413DRAFT_226898 [Trametes elegans]